VLHPAGFKMFGSVNFVTIIRSIIGIDVDSGVTIDPIAAYSFSRYVAGSNYTWHAKNGAMSSRVYNGDEFDSNYVDGDLGYNLEDKSLEQTYDLGGNPIQINSIGWMTKQSLSDYDIRQPQDYFEEDVYDGLYQESSYILTPTIDETSFSDMYLVKYSVYDFSDVDYSE
jgi:hypothetical protein